MIFKLLEITILAEVIFSYIPSMRENPIFNTIEAFNYPVLQPFRILQQKVMPNFGMIDISPILAILVLNMLTMILY